MGVFASWPTATLSHGCAPVIAAVGVSASLPPLLCCALFSINFVQHISQKEAANRIATEEAALARAARNDFLERYVFCSQGKPCPGVYSQVFPWKENHGKSRK